MARLLLAICPIIILSSVALFLEENLTAGPGQDKQKVEEPKKSTFKRLNMSSDEDLRKELYSAPEVGLDQSGAAYLLTVLGKLSKSAGTAPDADLAPKYYTAWAKQNKKPEMAALPWRFGVNSQMSKEMAEELHVFSKNLRAAMRSSITVNDVRPTRDKVRKSLEDGYALAAVIVVKLDWQKPQAVPSLAQMLQTENIEMRTLMIEYLAAIKGKEAGIALAQRAVFDLSPEVREIAVRALVNRPPSEYQKILLDALQWPWQPAVDHAAEAIAALKLKQTVPDLIELLKSQDPKLPFKGEDKSTYVREVVRINHMSNCLLCHAPSMFGSDLVRGRIPDPNEDPPPLYYQDHFGTFVHADIVFLRQDFSVAQPVERPGKWPGYQRYDYLLRTRKATPKEIGTLVALQKENKTLQGQAQRDAILFALRELTGEDRGSRTGSWLPLLNGILKKSDDK